MMATQTAPRESAQESINGRLYREQNLVSTYLPTRLHPAESTAMVRYRDDIHGQRVLDLGCGAGRLATYLRPLVGEYVGVDVSRHMVDYCRRTFRGLEFIQGDMRSMPQIDDESFDSVFAIANLFDAVTHAERLDVLAEVRRILAPRGLLVFSAHNRHYREAGYPPKLGYHRNPLTQMRLLVDYLQARSNHRRIKPFHRFEADYALLNDSGNNYHTLHYYVSRDVQANQLAEAGFELLECLGEYGETFGRDDRDDAYSSIMYVARRST